MFRRSYQNCKLRVETNIWWKIGFPLKSVTVFTSFLVFRQKNASENGWNISARPSDLHSKCAERHLENKTNFRGEHVFSINWGFIAEKTNEFWRPAFLTKLRFASPEHNLLFLFEYIFLIFSSLSGFENKVFFKHFLFFHFLRDLNEKLFTFFHKKFSAHLSKIAFYV